MKIRTLLTAVFFASTLATAPAVAKSVNFFTPNFKFTTQFNISQKMAAGIDIEAKYIDFMTLSANFIGATFRTYFQMRL